MRPHLLCTLAAVATGCGTAASTPSRHIEPPPPAASAAPTAPVGDAAAAAPSAPAEDRAASTIQPRSGVTHVDRDPATASAGLDDAVIRRAIRRAMPDVQRCYEAEPDPAQALDQPVNVRFVVGVDGKVESALATGSSPALAACLERVIKRLELPRPADGAKLLVSYPFVFHAA